MKITVHSDLHLDNIPYTPLVNEGGDTDVLILSGDIVSSESILQPTHQDFFKHCSDQFKHVIYVPGNHEFYESDTIRTLENLKKGLERFPNVHFLYSEAIVIDDVKFLGHTLWADCNKMDPWTMYLLPSKMADFTYIINTKNGKPITPSDYVRMHLDACEFLKTEVESAPEEMKIVIATHFAPSFKSVGSRYIRETVTNGGYASDLSDFILDHPNIKLWTHGHIHSVSDYMIGDTRVICNPRGFCFDASTYNLNHIVEI